MIRTLTTWRVPGSIDEVYALISDFQQLPRWWPAGFYDALEIQPGDGSGIGRIVRLETRGWLPFVLHWHTNAIEAEPTRHLRTQIWGDLDGWWDWRFNEQTPGWVTVTCDWETRVRKPVLRQLAPLLKPLLEANQRSVMAKGQESLRLALARRKATTESQRLALMPPPSMPGLGRGQALLGMAAIAALVLARKGARNR
jgi:hypothetical protein